MTVRRHQPLADDADVQQTCGRLYLSRRQRVLREGETTGEALTGCLDFDLRSVQQRGTADGQELKYWLGFQRHCCFEIPYFLPTEGG